MKYFFVLLCSVIAVKVNAASFDCTKAATPLEKTICGNSNLSILDEKLSDAYKNARGSSEDPTKLRTEQLDWLKDVRKCQTDISCIESLYISRLGVLRQLAANTKQDQTTKTTTATATATATASSGNQSIQSVAKASSENKTPVTSTNSEKLKAPPSELVNDKFLAGYLFDIEQWKRKESALDKRYEELKSRNPEDQEIIKIQNAISVVLDDNQLSKKDSSDVYNKKMDNIFEAAKQLWSACEKSSSIHCKYKVPEYQIKFLAQFAKTQNDFRYFIKDGTSRYRNLADLGDPGSVEEVARIYGRFALSEPEGLNWRSLDDLRGSYSPEVYDLDISLEYYRKAISSGFIQGEACENSIKLIEKRTAKIYENDYLKMVGISKVCNYNYQILNTVDKNYISQKQKDKDTNDEYYKKLVTNNQKKYDNFKLKTESIPYTAIVECKVGNTVTFLAGCFNSKIGTKTAVQFSSNNKSINLNIMNNFTGSGVSASTSTVLIIDLEKKFKFTAQKAAESPLTLAVKIVDTRTGNIIQTKSAFDQFQTINFEN